MDKSKQANYVNMRHVAKLAGVSVATVSRCLNGGPISPEAKLSVEEAIHKTDYVSNACARGVFSKEYKTIGLMVSNMSNPFFTELASTIENYAYGLGYAVYLCITNDDIHRELYYIDLLKGFRVDGVITSRTICKNEYMRWSAPVVSFENEISEDVFSVSMDNYLGGWKVAEALHKAGRSNLLHISGPEIFEATNERRKGFADYCHKHNLSFDVISLNHDLHPDEEFPTVLEQIDWNSYDGVFVFNDITAALVMSYLLNVNISIPQEMSIFGFDDSYVSRLTTPKLSTVRQPVKKIAHLLVDALISQIQTGNSKHDSVYIEPELIIRDSA